MLKSTKDRLYMQVLVGCDDCCRNLGSFQQLFIAGRLEVRPRLFADELQPVFLEIGHADEIDHRVTRGNLAAEKAYAPGSDDRKADPLRLLSQTASPWRASSAGQSARCAPLKD